MYLGLAFFSLWICSAPPQTDLGATSRVQEIKILGSVSPDLSVLLRLRNALTDKAPEVRLEALKYWAKKGNGFDSTLSELVEDSARPNESIFTICDEWKDKLLTQVKPQPEDNKEVQLQALRTLCTFTDSVTDICPPHGRCSTGEESNLWYRSRTELAVQAKARRPILMMLLNDPNPQVVFPTLQALDSEVQKSLFQRAQTLLVNPDKRFKAIGASIIGRSFPESSLRLLAPLLDDGDADVRETARSLITMTPRQLRELIMPAEGRSANLRLTALTRLLWSDSKEAHNIIKPLLSDPDPRIRSEALSGFFREKDSKDPSIVQEFLSDQSPVVRGTALKLAADLKLPQLMPLVREGLLSPIRALREAALWAVGKVPGSEELSAEQVHCVELGVENSWMANPAFDDPKFAYLIQECLNSENVEVRQLLCFRYSHRASKKPVNILILLAKDANPKIASLAIDTLAEITEPTVFEVLVELSSSHDRQIQIGALRGLGKSMRPEAVAALLSFADNPNGRIRSAAQAALDQLNKALGG